MHVGLSKFLEDVGLSIKLDRLFSSQKAIINLSSIVTHKHKHQTFAWILTAG